MTCGEVSRWAGGVGVGGGVGGLGVGGVGWGGRSGFKKAQQSKRGAVGRCARQAWQVSTAPQGKWGKAALTPPLSTPDVPLHPPSSCRCGAGRA